MCTRTDYPPFETDAREDAVCPLHGPNLYTCPDDCAFAAAFPRHPAATLTGGAVPVHEPGAYPSLSCCGGSVQLVPIALGLPYSLEPVVMGGPGWYGHGPNADDLAEPAFAAVYLEPYEGPRESITVAELYIRADPHDDAEPRECGAELAVDDLAALALRLCEIGAAAATQDGYHFGAEAFDRAREQLARVYARDADDHSEGCRDHGHTGACFPA